MRTPRLHVVTGKGGTGKTTVAGALALALARQAKQVLLVEVEGRQGLAQLFDRPPLPTSEVRLAAAGGGDVIGLAIDAETAMLEYLEMFYSIKRAGTVLRKMGAIDFVTTIAPGLRDVLLTGKVKEAVTRTERGGRPTFDAVVLDAPPTGRITQFLQVTYEAAQLARVGPIHRQSQSVIELLHSDLTMVHVVTLLEEMPVQESLDAVDELRTAGYRLGRLLVNRARPALLTAAAPKPAVLAQGLTEAGLDPALAPALAAGVQAYSERQAVADRAGADLEQAGLPITRLPELVQPLDLGSLFELADALDVQDWA